MKKGIFFICTLFVVLTGFNQQERVVEQGNADLLGRASVGVVAPEITQPLWDFSINEGGIATFLVELAQPIGNEIVTWFKDNKVVVVDARVKTYVDKTTVTLVINRVCPSDAGFYRVVISNDVGKVESKARLTVRPE